VCVHRYAELLQRKRYKNLSSIVSAIINQ